jgi:AraC-like DNA-binding protein
MRYLETPPHPALEPFVECLWLLEGKTTGEPQVVTPDGHPELLVHFGEPVDQLTPRPRLEPTALFFGQLDEPLRLLPRGRLGIAGARLKPEGAWRLVSRASIELAGRATPLEEIWGATGSDLSESVREAHDGRSRLRALEGALLARLARAAPGDPVVETALSTVRRSRGCGSIEHLARTCHLSRRQLERRFKERVGLTPKRYARITRFQNVLRLVERRPRLSWAAISVVTGYFDQAHLIRDFRAFTGRTPSAWVGERNPLSDRFQSGARLERLLSTD